MCVCLDGSVSWTTELIAQALLGSSLVFQQHLAIKKIIYCLRIVMNTLDYLFPFFFLISTSFSFPHRLASALCLSFLSGLRHNITCRPHDHPLLTHRHICTKEMTSSEQGWRHIGSVAPLCLYKMVLSSSPVLCLACTLYCWSRYSAWLLASL